jgi:hypothetical protein
MVADTSRQSFGDDETEFLQFAMDLLCAPPIGVLLRQLPDQHANLFGDLRSAARRPRTPEPIEAEGNTIPTDYCRRLHDGKDVGPAGPPSAQGSPEGSVGPVQNSRWPFAFEQRRPAVEGEECAA